MTNFEFLIAFSVACGNGLRFVLPLSISLKGRCMDIPNAMTDVNDVISVQLNMNNLGHEWYSRAYDCQTLLDATGDSTNTPAGKQQQHFHRTFTIPFINDLLR